jgi:hypothetical protein
MIPATAVVLVLVALATVLIALYGSGGSFDSSGGNYVLATVTESIQSFAQAIAKAEGFGIPGAIPTMAHNPGDLVVPGWTGAKLGSEGISVFGSDDEGWQRLYHQLNLIVSGQSRVYTLDDTISSMADKWTNTNSKAWALNVAGALGVSTDAALRDVLGG